MTLLIKNKITAKATLSKDLLAEQNYRNLMVRLNSANLVFSGTEGLGEAANNSSFLVALFGGTADYRVTGVMKYPSPTTQAQSEIGVVGRFTSVDQTAVATANYYYARVDNGQAKLTKVVGGAFTTLKTDTFNLAQDVLVTITLQMVGTSIQATYSASGLTTVVQSQVDSDITAPGVAGFRSLSSGIWCRSLTVEQL